MKAPQEVDKILATRILIAAALQTATAIAAVEEIAPMRNHRPKFAAALQIAAALAALQFQYSKKFAAIPELKICAAATLATHSKTLNPNSTKNLDRLQQKKKSQEKVTRRKHEALEEECPSRAKRREMTLQRRRRGVAEPTS